MCTLEGDFKVKPFCSILIIFDKKYTKCLTNALKHDTFLVLRN